MKFRSTVIIVAAALALLACGKHEHKVSVTGGGQDPQPAPEGLSGKSTQEVLKTKYTKAQLVCSLWTQRGVVSTAVTPNAQFVWDLLKDFATEKTFKLAARMPDHSIELVFNVTDVKILGSLNHTNEDGSVYHATWTPTILLTYKGKVDTVYGPGMSGSGDASGGGPVFEKIKRLEFNRSEASDGGLPFSDVMECLLDTEAKPEYRGQFTKVSK